MIKGEYTLHLIGYVYTFIIGTFIGRRLYNITVIKINGGRENTEPLLAKECQTRALFFTSSVLRIQYLYYSLLSEAVETETNPSISLHPANRCTNALILADVYKRQTRWRAVELC